MSAANTTWKVVGLVSGLAAAKASRSAMEMIWKKTKGGDPPRNPASPTTDWKEAVTWAVASGIALSLSRMLATKGAATAWKKTTGSLPPGLEDVGA